MWYIATFEAKDTAKLKEINKEREEWISQGKDKLMLDKCRTFQRYEVLGKSPLTVVFIIETDDPRVLNILSRHFGDSWNSYTYPVTQRQIFEALEQDCTIIGG